ncbi:hypothetical protein [Acetobacter conturbans]|nr:hypothetical protein [Acetobacter conturbans]
MPDQTAKQEKAPVLQSTGASLFSFGPFIIGWDGSVLSDDEATERYSAG